MKRYTFKSDDYYVISGEDCFEDSDENYCGPAVDKLAEYENLEEAGRLIILPCKIGDTVYQPGYKFTECSAHSYIPRHSCDSFCEDCYADECDSVSMPHIYKGKVCEMRVLSSGHILVKVSFEEKWDNSSFSVGVDIFLTRAAAEEALCRM